MLARKSCGLYSLTPDPAKTAWGGPTHYDKCYDDQVLRPVFSKGRTRSVRAMLIASVVLGSISLVFSLARRAMLYSCRRVPIHPSPVVSVLHGVLRFITGV